MISDNVCQVWVVRPGPTADNYLNHSNDKLPPVRWSSADETPLSNDGVVLAERNAVILKNVHFDAVYCSQAYRTRQTAEIILGQHRNVPITSDPMFYEMKLGPTEGKTPSQIIQLFCEATKYPEPSTQLTLPNLWAKRGGAPLIDSNDAMLDKWRDDMDTFDRFTEEFLPKIKKVALENLGKTLLIVPHGTPMKAIVADAMKTTSDRVKCDKGSWYVAEIDNQGMITVDFNRSKGISID